LFGGGENGESIFGLSLGNGFALNLGVSIGFEGSVIGDENGVLPDIELLNGLGIGASGFGLSL
jgi:hypothetical protein